MQAQETFVTRIKYDTNEVVKVILDDSRRIYHQEYNGIKFFVYCGIGGLTWDSIEKTTGLSLKTGYSTKKECIQRTKEYIDWTPDIQKRINAMVERNRNCRICTEKEMNQ